MYVLYFLTYLKLLRVDRNAADFETQGAYKLAMQYDRERRRTIGTYASVLFMGYACNLCFRRPYETGSYCAWR